MICLFCKGKAVKNGLYEIDIQRYKCLNCNKTFSERTIESVSSEKDIRLVLHLILAGCSNADIACELEIEEGVIEKWGKRYIKDVKMFLPAKPLLSIRTLIIMFRAIENSRIPKLAIYRNPKRRK